jgi:putative multiple sugar transport system permease protein
MRASSRPTSATTALLLSLLAIMVFFQFTTGGTLFKPVNMTNLILQNSYIVIMALGMLLIIVAGHIDLSVGSVSGFVGAVAAVMMVDWKSDPLRPSCAWPGGGRDRRAQGYFVAYMKIPSFIVTLAGMLVFKGLALTAAGRPSVGPFPTEFQLLSSGFIPDPDRP